MFAAKDTGSGWGAKHGQGRRLTKDDWKYQVNVARIADTDGPDTNLPRTLYYYCKLDTALELILPPKQLLLSPIANTNDPRENKTFQFAAISPPNQKDFNLNNWPGRVSKILREDCKVLCFSSDYDDFFGFELSRMWAYYGGQHKGLCLAIDTAEFIEENSGLFDPILLRRIEYVKFNVREPTSHKWVDFGRVESIGLSRYLKEEFRQDHLKYLYFTKDQEWESERESRLVHFSEKKEEEYCRIDRSLKRIYLGVDFHKSYVPALKLLCPGIDLIPLRYNSFRLIPSSLE